MEKDTIKIIDENGQEKVVDIVAFFTLKSNRKKYLIYTENKKDEKTETPDYANMTVSELKKLAKEKGVTGYSTMKKDELISSLN